MDHVKSEEKSLNSPFAQGTRAIELLESLNEKFDKLLSLMKPQADYASWEMQKERNRIERMNETMKHLRPDSTEDHE